MEKLKSIITIFLLAVSLLNSTALAKSTSVLLQEGLYAEEVEGNLDAAIKIYQQIIDDSSAQRSHIAQAMYRQGMCYLKEQNELQAKAVFEKLLAQFSEQTEIIDKVKPLLAKMVSPDPAALMPPETLVYFEIGSPGKQIETILNMLKGTPFENPLAAMYGGAASQKTAGGRTPGDIMTALLNPSMVAEFKKIRGMAIGITEIRENNPPAIAVLYPGESDALRGIILAALGMVAQPGQPIEGMQTVQIQNTAGVAYDDSAIIIAQPLEQLTWCVKQYQGITDEPTLASNNKCFANVSRQARRENALTVWANVAQVFTDVIEQFPDEHLPEEIRFVDTVIDPKNVDELITYLSIQENRIALEANLAFKEGHHCVAYDMIRTPNLSKDGFQGVPAEAVGLVSIALGEGGGPGVEKARETVENLTGLDIGREIFANIEQITVFAVPSSQSGGTSESGIASLPYLGVAVTSKNPQQTHQILTQILSLADTAATLSENQQSVQQSKVAAGKYLLPLDGAQKVYCYVGQTGKTTTLAFSPDVLEKSLSTVKSGKSALTGGILQEPLREITPDTSKLALINVGGAIQVADAYLTATHENPQNPGHKMLAQLGQNFDKTFVQLRTRENVDNFNLHVGIDNLPSLNNVFPLLMQLSTVDLTAKVKATQPRPRDGVVVSPKTDMKLSWRSGVNAASHKVYFGAEDEIEKMPLLAESNSWEVKVPQLQEGTRYFWRVDEVGADGTVITGDVWSFATGKLVAWWRLDETKGTKASDSSGNNHTGMLVGGPPWQPSGGKVDGALSFDGVDDYVDLTDEMANLGGDFTIVLWAYPTGAGNWARFIDFGNGEYADNVIFARYGISNDLIFEVYS
ncbi:MAG: hypothetical protein AMJ43_08440, partial [Coxiella sp. DG_40]